jgi:DNA-binding NarL/FixJ family response regulator
MNKKINVLIVDDHPAMRHGIAQLLANEADLDVCGQAGDRRETLDALTANPPDLVVLDIALKNPDRNGLDLITDIHTQMGPIPILIYSMHDEMIYAERALRAGAKGYLMKQEPVHRIIDAIRKVITEGVYVSEPMNRKLLLRHIGPPSVQPAAITPEHSLSDREFEVFRLIGQGLPPREIAGKLCLSTRTVETHRMNIRKKLGLANASEVTRFAVEWSRRKDDSPT